MDSTNSEPRPGRAKTVSITTVPPITQLVWAPSTEIELMSAFGSTWTRMVRPVALPLARAVVT
ncbi:hypothetical protein D3C87_2102050 [compost metagenome]